MKRLLNKYDPSMIPFRKSIGFRLLAVSFILLCVPLLIDSFIVFQRGYKRALEDAKSYLIELARYRELPLSQIQPLNKQLISLIVTFLNLSSRFPEKPDPELNKTLNRIADTGNFFEVFVLKYDDQERFTVIASSLPQNIGKDVTDFLKLNNLFSSDSYERGFTTFIAYDEKTEKPYFTAVHLIYTFGKDKNKPVGALAVSDNISERLEVLLAKEKHDYEVNFALLLNSGIVFAASDTSLNFNYFKPLSAEYLELFKKENPFSKSFLAEKPIAVFAEEKSPFIEFDWNGETQIGYISKNPKTSFYLLAYASKKAIYKRPFIDFFDVYSIYVAILGVGGFLAWLLTKRMARPIQDLSKVMKDIQEGNLYSRYEKDPFGYEINTLGSIFNEMIDTVLVRKHQAEEERVHKEILAKELVLGREVQLSLLPSSMPSYPGVDLATHYIPAIEVGGDFYDLFVKEKKETKELVLSIADASGKGVQACFYSLTLRNFIRTYAKEYDNIAKVAGAANNLFCRDTRESGMFVTALLGVYEYKTKRFQYFSAGHTPPIIHRKGGNVEILQERKMAMGVEKMEEEKLEPHFSQLESGDTLVFYTDGITEAHDAEKKLFGIERLIDILKKESHKPAIEIAASIVRKVRQFSAHLPQYDDITLIVMKIE